VAKCRNRHAGDGELVQDFIRAALIAGLLTVPIAAVAQEAARCPERIAYVDSDAAVQRDAGAMKTIYARVGCPDVRFVGLPGRRGVVAFNAGEVQGELMRLPAVEIEYSRPFLRLPVPVLQVSGRLWARDAAAASGGPAGFVLGVVWQEQYAQSHGGTGYAGQTELLRAYGNGLIDRFLAEDAAVAAAVRDGRLTERPVPDGQPLVTADLHHYLGGEFAAVAAAVTAELERMAQYGNGPAMQ
jgi:hypothetical protein